MMSKGKQERGVNGKSEENQRHWKKEKRTGMKKKNDKAIFHQDKPAAEKAFDSQFS